MTDDHGHAPRDTRIERWLRSRSDGYPAPDRDRVLRGTLATIPTTRQRRRWWDRRGRGRADRAARRTAVQPSTVTWRFTTMNATKIIAGVAIATIATVATVGGLRTVQTGTESGTAVVTAAVEAGPATFSGTIDFRGLPVDEAIEPYEWPDGSTSAGRRQAGAVVETTEPRFGGLASSEFYNLFQGEAGETGMFWGDMRIEDDDGVWVGPLTGAGAPRRSFDVAATLIGEGGYEGLFAVVFFDASPTGLFDVRGTILVGEPPPASVGPAILD